MAITEVGSATNSGTSLAPSVSVSGIAGITAGDVLLFFLHSNLDTITLADNNGASATTEVFEEANTGEGSRYAVYSRVAGGSEPTTFNFTISGAVSQRWSIICRVFRGVNTSSIWDVTPSASTRTISSTGTAATAPTMTLGTAGALGIAWALSDTATGTWSLAAGAAGNSYGTEVEVGNQIQATYTRTFASAGASGTTQMNNSNTGDWVAHQFALKLASVAAARATIPQFFNRAV